MIYAILSFSVVLNIYLLFYARWVLKNWSQYSENMDDIRIVFNGFKEHVESVHESEMFYGDTSLQNLIKHSKLVLEEIESYGNLLDEQTSEADTEEG